MGTIKDRNGMDLIQAEDIKKRWQEYTEELYEKDLHDPENPKSSLTYRSHSRETPKFMAPLPVSPIHPS